MMDSFEDLSSKFILVYQDSTFLNNNHKFSYMRSLLSFNQNSQRQEKKMLNYINDCNEYIRWSESILVKNIF